MAKRKKKITKTLVNKLLREAAFDPKKHPILQAVIDDHGDDPRYLENRAIEFIREAQLAFKSLENGIKQIDEHIYHEKLQKAMCMLALARASTLLLCE